ncbi:PcfB family protein [Ruminococcaceae bacterium OttesenSCG-928-I18]|nr:PcfB family protein [Ruminococcaceae bacterium OttesenSCG-928-I18]
MQDQVNEKSVVLVIKGGKITGKVLAKAISLLLKQGKKQINKAQAPKIGKGKQSVKDLVRQGAGVANIEITDANIGSFEPIAKKYGIDYALKKDTTETPPKWLVFFKSKDADALTAAFKEFTAKNVQRSKSPEKPSLITALKQMKELAAKLVTDKVKNKDRGMEL